MEKKKVLVIDDEQIILDSVKKILGAENFEVDPAISIIVARVSRVRPRGCLQGMPGLLRPEGGSLDRLPRSIVVDRAPPGDGIESPEHWVRIRYSRVHPQAAFPVLELVPRARRRIGRGGV